MEHDLTLTHSQLERLRLEDGLVDSVSDVAESDLRFDPAADKALRRMVRQALLPSNVPTISELVMHRIGLEAVPLQESVTNEARESNPIADAVMNRLHPGRPVHLDLKAAIVEESGEIVRTWPVVAGAIGANVQTSLGGLIRDAVGQESGHDGVAQVVWRRPVWAVPAAAGLFLAAAAAILLWVGSQSSDPDRVAEKVIAGPVDIEALDVGAANAVQILQMGEEAPTIILVEPDGAAE